MLDPQILVNLLPQVYIRVDFVNHNSWSVRVYFTEVAIALANKMTGQTATNTINPKATSSDRMSGCARYAYRSLKKREARTRSEFLVSVFMSK